MTVIYALKCDRCDEFEPLDGVNSAREASRYQTCWNDYSHVCDDCATELDTEASAGEEESDSEVDHD